MAKILTPLDNRDLDYKYSMILNPFRIQLQTLADLGLPNVLEIPAGFIHDYESVPLFRGTSKTGGVVHDYLCRYDSIPKVTKKIAADCYFEVMEGSDKLKARGNLQLIKYWFRRWLKYSVVCVWPGYFHKHHVFATLEKLKHSDWQ